MTASCGWGAEDRIDDGDTDCVSIGTSGRADESDKYGFALLHGDVGGCWLSA